MIGLSGIAGGGSNRLLKNGASGRDPALRGSCKCSHMSQYAALSKSPRALADGLMLVFQHPAKESRLEAAPTGHLMLGM
jgi:hypothetical protein